MTLDTATSPPTERTAPPLGGSGGISIAYGEDETFAVLTATTFVRLRASDLTMVPETLPAPGCCRGHLIGLGGTANTRYLALEGGGTLGAQAVECACLAERCNGVDDDCDGIIDEAFALGATCACPFSATSGVTECDPGGLTTRCGGYPAELCGDMVDNNCDGAIDEGCP